MADRVQVRCHDVRERPRSVWRSLWCICTCALTLGLAAPAAAHDIPAAGPQCDEDVATFASRVLLFTETAGARSDAIGAATAAICEVAGARGIAVDRTEDSGAFDSHLSAYDAVVFLHNTGDVLTDLEQGVLEAYVRGGGGFAAIGAAAEAEPFWSFYGTLVGSRVGARTAEQPATVEVYDPSNASTKPLPRQWRVTDSWYTLASNPRGNVHVLAGLDETSYDAGAGAMGRDHPITWCKDVDNGRSWYTGIGNASALYDSAEVRQHLVGGIQTAIGGADVECGATIWRNYQKTLLTKEVGEPMDLAVLPDGRVLSTDRRGRVRLYDPADGSVSLAAELEVYAGEEDGLQTVTLDPNFETNQWVYLYYSRPESAACSQADQLGGVLRCGVNRLARFKFTGDTLDLSTEQTIIEVPTQRDLCCHVGGDVGFDSHGYLYLTTGDNTNSWASDGYSPIDERPNRGPFDAQRSSGNTNDLRGKLLRINVAADGSYTIPDGNLFGPNGRFPAVAGKTRPEIYSMGHRNPFRFTIDPATDWVYMGEVGPDAGGDNPLRGPRQYEELNIIKRAGNGGWPHCIGTPQNIGGLFGYRDYNFATGESGPAFDCANGPTNDSPINTGLTQLPPVDNLPTIWYPYANFSLFPELGSGGGTAMGGPVYHYDADLQSDTKWPAYWDGSEIFYEWSRSYLKDVRFTESGELLQINPMFAGIGFSQPMDMEFGPDGSLYVIEYGGGFFTVGPNVGLYKIDYVKGRHRPDIVLDSDADSGPAPLTVNFDASGSSDQDGDALTFAWDFDGDGTTDATGATAAHTYTANGVYAAKVTVTDSTSRSSTQTLTITVGNTRPQVNVEGPVEGGFYEWTDTVHYRISVTDPEDGTIDCDEVNLVIGLGHDEHSHPIDQKIGCEGDVVTDVIPEGHSPSSRLFYVLRATYSDHGAAGTGVLEGSREITLRPKFWEAELYDRSQGVQQTVTSGASAGRRVGSVSRGDWWAYENVNLRKIDSITARVSSGSNNNGRIEFRLDAPDGPKVGEVTVPNTGGWDSYRTLDPAPVTDPGGTHTLYLVAADDQAGDLLDLDWLRFNGVGVATKLAAHPTADPGTGPAPLQTTLEAGVQDAPAGTTFAWDFGDGSTGQGADVTHSYAAPGAYRATFTATLDGATIADGGVDVRAFERLDGTLAVTRESATPFVGDPTTVSATFDPSGDQSAAGRDVTFEVYRESRLSGLPSGHSSGTPYVRVDDQVAETDGGGVARFTYTGEVVASDIVVACLAYTGSCLPSGQSTLVIDDAGEAANLRDDVVADRGRIDWRFEPASGEWTSLWDGRTFAGWDHAGSGGFQRVIDDGAPALQAQGSGGILWYNAREFADYELEVSYEHNGVGDNGGVFLRFPNPGENRAVADQGYQVAILDRVDNVAQRTGSVLGCAAAQKLNAKPVGEGYNRFRIRFVGTRIEVYLNEDAQANADPVAVCDNADRADQGFVGIENAGASIRYRDIRIRELRAGVQRPLVRVSATPQSGLAPLDVAFRADATDPEGQGITYAWDFGDGTTGSGQSVNHTYAQAGYFQAEVTATDGKGATSSAQIEIAAASPGECLRVESGYCVSDLTGHYNTDGISEEGDFDDGNFDDAGWSFAGDTMPPAGPVTYHGVPFEFPSYAAGRKNTVEARGQTLPLAPGAYEEIRLLASAHHGSPNSSATINYVDGSTEQVRLALTDWAQSPAYGELVAIAANHRHDQDSDSGPPVNIFIQTLPADPQRPVKSITLPNERRIHLFAVSLRTYAQCTIEGTDAGEPLAGTADDDVICGLGGDDVIDGGGGDDLLRGGDGADHLIGGAGTDECIGGPGIDTAKACERESGTSKLALSPGHASTYTDETHELTAAFGGDDPPPAGAEVRFELYRKVGDDHEKVAEEVVAAGTGGTAVFDYVHDEPAEDVIVACTGATACGGPGAPNEAATRRATATNRIIPTPPLDADYDLLFDGTSTAGWMQSGPGEFRVEDGSMVTYGGLGLLWYAGRQYRDFSLKLAWKLTGETNNSGVFARFPDPGNDPFVAVNQGYEIQIYDGSTGEPQKTGSIYNFKREEARNSNPIGEWNQYEVRAVGQQYTVTLNGQVVNTFTGARNLAGYIGLQNHDAGSHVHFRYVRIKELDPPETTATLAPAEPDGDAGWYRSPVTVSLAADDGDGSGVASTEIKVDDGAFAEYDGPVPVGGDGEHVVAFRSTDSAGNVEESKTVEFKIDRTTPAITCSASPARLWPPNHKLMRVTAAVELNDATSGADGYVLEAVTSDEPDAGTSREDVAGDIGGWTLGTADLEGRLRAERVDAGDGRTYRLTYAGRDVAGNEARCTAEVVVPLRVSTG